jgi:hypothetical protein
MEHQKLWIRWRRITDAPAATSEAPIMGISFFSIVGVFSSVVEKMMGQERQLQ